MLDPKRLRNDLPAVVAGLARRGFTFDEASFATHEFTLDPGERIWFYSDGIVEAMNDAEEIFGLEELERRLDQHREAPLPAAVAGVMEAVELGVWGLVLKESASVQLVDALRRVAMGLRALDPALVAAAGERGVR